MNERRTDPDTLSEIKTRMTLMEADLARGSKTMLWLRSVSVLVVIQIVVVAVAYGRLSNQMENLNLDDLERNVSTALLVLGDHGTELEAVRNEQFRLRGNIDDFNLQLNGLRDKIDKQTVDRFFRTDGDRLEVRVERLENFILEKQ